MKVLTVVGTRPEIIRLSRVILELDRFTDHVLVHTGQNWDYTLNQVFFEDLGLREPDHYLGVDVSTLGHVMGEILIKIEQVLLEERPDAFLVLGDTNSAIAALMARRLKIPVFHMEAGNRSFDQNVPEETNRKMVDHISDFNLCYTEHARRNLLAEGLHPRRIIVTGSPIREVLNAYRPQIEASDAVSRLGLTPRGYFLVSTHREENVDRPDRLRALLGCLTAIRDEFDMPVLVSTHPRTRKRLEVLDNAPDLTGITFHAPLGFHDYNKLQMDAFCVVSDSGTIAEESSMLGFPAVTPRDAIERPEAVDTGAIMFTGLDPADLVLAVRIATSPEASPIEVPADYCIENTSRRAVSFIVSAARRHHQWAGVRVGEPTA